VIKTELSPEREFALRSRRSFLTLGGGLLTVAAAWTYLRSRPPDGGMPGPFRRVLEWNEKLTSSVLFRDSHLAPEFPPSRREEIRPNGDMGLDDDIENSDWKLRLTPRGSDVAMALALSDIHALPKTELITEFKCIEGWSSVVQWGGVRFRDFLKRHAPLSERAAYVAMATPDDEYYIGIDMASALHPQTLLAYEMNGQPLQDDHGAPLRLVTAVKYGIKSIKRIGTIWFPDRPPRDYWAERGYDYYAGL
jgi:DMSO/TMAO reductase YedYZ molybdopterin-dependent catalytic subunit